LTPTNCDIQFVAFVSWPFRLVLVKTLFVFTMKILLSFLLFTVAGAFIPQSEEGVIRGIVALKSKLESMKVELFWIPFVFAHGCFSVAVGYVPDGMSPEQYKKLKEKEREESKKKRFGAFGPQTFKSRSLQSFQKDMEKGEVSHLMPVMNAKERIKKGELKEEDIPYMQRLGSWDNSDVKGAKKKKVRSLQSILCVQM